jgi:hypothetical protein
MKTSNIAERHMNIPHKHVLNFMLIVMKFKTINEINNQNHNEYKELTFILFSIIIPFIMISEYPMKNNSIKPLMTKYLHSQKNQSKTKGKQIKSKKRPLFFNQREKKIRGLLFATRPLESMIGH